MVVSFMFVLLASATVALLAPQVDARVVVGRSASAFRLEPAAVPAKKLLRPLMPVPVQKLCSGGVPCASVLPQQISPPRQWAEAAVHLWRRIYTALRTARHNQPEQVNDGKDVVEEPWLYEEEVDEPKNLDPGVRDGNVDWSVKESVRRPHEFDWCTLLVLVLMLLVFDQLVLRRVFPQCFQGHVALLCVWISVAGAYAYHIQLARGGEAAEQWIVGYVLESMLSMDTLFIFHLVFRAFKTPKYLQHKAMFVWFVISSLLHTLFFMVLSVLLTRADWIPLLFGVLLICSGILTLCEEAEEDDGDVADYVLVHCLKRLFGDRIATRYDEEEHGFFFWDGPYIQASLLTVVVVQLTVTDIVCSLDNVSAKAAQIPDRFIACSSSLFALFFLRTLYFIIQDLIELFDLLKYGIFVLLVFIGGQLIVQKWYLLPLIPELTFILVVFLLCIVLSLTRRWLYGVPFGNTAGPSAKVAEPAEVAKMSGWGARDRLEAQRSY